MLTIHLDPARQLTGTVLVLAGAVLHFVSKGYLRQSKRYIGQSQSLTMRGPYRFTRNPFYLANLIAEIGLLIVIGSWPLAVIYLTVWTWVYRKQILAEEATLESLAGERLCSYRDRVPRLLPRPWRVLRASEASGPYFDWHNTNIGRGKGLERAMRLSSYPLLLVVAATVRIEGLGALVDVHSVASSATLGFVFVNVLGKASTWLIRCLAAGSTTATVQSSAVAMNSLARSETGQLS